MSKLLNVNVRPVKGTNVFPVGRLTKEQEVWWALRPCKPGLRHWLAKAVETDRFSAIVRSYYICQNCNHKQLIYKIAEEIEDKV